MSEVRIRVPAAIKPGELITVRTLVNHPMEVMAFAGGKPVEKTYNFVHKVAATYNGKLVFEAETTQAVSANPFFGFPLKVGAPGVLKIVFTDTLGKTYEGQVEIKF